MTLFIRIASIIGTLVVAALAYGIANLGGVLVSAKTVEDHAAFLAPHMRAHFPEGDGPFPTVIQFHGCGSVHASQDDWAAFFVEQGYGAVIVDSLAPRGIGRMAALSTVCTALQLPGRERAGDVIAGITLASAMPEVDPERLFLGGWSHGGWAIMDLLAMDLERQPPPNLSAVDARLLDGVRGAILVYPYSGFPALSRDVDWQTRVPVLAFAGTADTVANPDHTQAAFDRQIAAGADIQFILFQGATHDFDVDEDEFLHQGDFDAAATARAHAITREFLVRTSDN